MKILPRERLTIYAYISLLILVMLYMLSKPLIILFNLCSSFGTYCKYFTGFFYNSVIYWLLAVGLGYAFIKYAVSEYSKYRYLRAFSAYRFDNTKLNKIISGYRKKINIFVSDEAKPIAFTAGIYKQSLYLSKGTIDNLDEEKLKALVGHEIAHIINNDVFHLLIARLASDVFFYLPGLRAIYNRLETEKEYCADDFAVKEVGNRNFLIDALLKVSQLKIEENQSIAYFAGGKTNVLKRIKKLQGEEVRHNFSRPALIITVVMAIFVSTLALNASANIVDNGCPMHRPVKANHFCLF